MTFFKLKNDNYSAHTETQPDIIDFCPEPVYQG